MDKKIANARLNDLVRDANTALRVAQAFADEHGLSFRFGPAYGMGGTYYGKAMQDDPDSWAPSDSEAGWYSSSMGC